MPIDEIPTGIFKTLARLLGWLILEVFIEIAIKGLGYTICRPFKKVDVDSITAAIVGILAWIVIINLSIILMSFVSS